MNASMDSPRRGVPWSTRLTVRWGGGRQQFGWCFFAIGMVFAWVFAPEADVSSLLHFRGELVQAEGRVTSSQKTGYSVGGSSSRSTGRMRSSGRPVMAHDYRFTVGGTNYEGVSYVTGGGPMEGRTVRVEFPAGRPGISRIQGMRRAALGPWMLLVLILPAVGLGVAVSGFLWSQRALSLLGRGAVAVGRLVDQQRTNRTVNKRVVQRLTYAYADLLSREHSLVVSTHQPQVLDNADQQRVLYDPEQPARAVLVGQLPGGVHLAEDGQAEEVPLRRVLAAVLPPILAFAVLVVGAVLRLG